MFCQRCDLTSCLSRHADQTDIWASKSQPTAKTGITQAKIREDGKERQGDRDIRRSLFYLPVSVFRISLSHFPCLFSSVLQRELSRMAAGASPIAWRHWNEQRAWATQQPNDFFLHELCQCCLFLGCRLQEERTGQLYKTGISMMFSHN